MAAGISVATSAKMFLNDTDRNLFLLGKPNSVISHRLLFSPIVYRPFAVFQLRKKVNFTLCFVLEEKKQGTGNTEEEDEDSTGEIPNEFNPISVRMVERLARKKSERYTYLVAAVMSSLGITSMAVAAVYSRFYWQMEGREVPVSEMFGTFALSVGAAVGMEFWARWAHRALWHASLWHMHESHHRPRDGPFELNDVFAVINSVPAIALLSYGFFHKGLLPGLCFGAGLGITVFGMAYMFIHDGLVHRRFPVGPIADVPYFRRVATAHQIHHSDKFKGAPYGLFLGPKELEEVEGLEELEEEINRRFASMVAAVIMSGEGLEKHLSAEILQPKDASDQCDDAGNVQITPIVIVSSTDPLATSNTTGEDKRTCIDTEQIIDVYEDENYLDIVIELCDSSDLYDRVLNRIFSDVEAAAVMSPLMEAIARCHRRGVAH
ncbi:hypothetical protein NE237_011630 [Protea cynaroides]|uniref:beta-carotene 3-hydroxylase n=1 Tax=Protea cynaroides TaxID=273540 RepID=A0A9Q0GVB1_9MAGN|nr:hypothetical protein NE237_011630 [Protea cynaroides]